MKWSRFGVCVLGSTLWSQAPPVIQSETRVVLVDVVVSDKKGGYVRDLTAKDFRVWEDNKEQAIQSFALESAAEPAGRTASEPQADHLVLMFDYSGMDGGDQIRARQAASRFIDANVGPNRVMAVANFDGSLRIAQSFTDNAGRLKDAVTGAKAGVISVNNSTAGTSASTDFGARGMLPALKGLASNLSTVPGRKSIVLLTGNVTASTDQKSALASAMEACNQANVAVYPIDVREVSMPAQFDAENGGGRGGRGGVGMGGGGGAGMGGGGGRGGRGGPGGDTDPAVTTDPTGASQQILFALASGTGGFVIRNAGELPGGLQKIGEEQREYYILGYTPSAEKEGVCHALKVKVDRGGTTVRARSSYCNGKQPDLVATKPAEKNLEQFARSDSASVAGSMQLPFFYTAPGVARVNLALEIPPGSIKHDPRKSNPATIDVLGIASTTDGETAARFTDTIAFNSGALNSGAPNSAGTEPLTVRYQKQFKIAPGQYRFTIVFGAGGETFGKLEQPLVVEPYQAGQFALSGVAMGKETRKAGEGGGLFDDHAALTVGGVELIPSGSNAFAKSDQAFCYFEVYLAGVEPPTIGLRILNPKTGAMESDGGTAKLAVPAGKSSVPVGLGVPLSALLPGVHRLEITATDAGGTTVRHSADFEIR